LAAALKLTPLVFIPYLALTGRGRMALRALAAFVLSIGVAMVALPGDAWTYWFGGKFTDVSRVTGDRLLAGSGAANQSLRGSLLRILPGTPHLTLIWLLACLALGALGLLLAVRAARRGDEAWGFMLIALTGLLICPVSWTHHWTIAIAGVIGLVGSRGRGPVKAARIAVGLAFVAGSSAIWLVIRPGRGHHPGATELLVLSNLYVLIGLGAIATAAALELRHATGRRARARRRVSLGPLVPAGRSPAFAAPGHPGDPVRAITTSQALAPDRQSLR
jgi:alpha-1,2-mannosyltransferase